MRFNCVANIFSFADASSGRSVSLSFGLSMLNTFWFGSGLG
jgi:hypothetical protein